MKPRRGVPVQSVPEHTTWQTMIQRCHNPNNNNFKYYGAKGIKVCERWRTEFWDFYADMGPRPSADHSLDRVDVGGDYEPGNVRWATSDEQRLNRTDSVRVDGEPLRDFCVRDGVGYSAMFHRIKSGCSPQEALRLTRRGPPKGAAKANAKLTDETVRELRRLRGAGLSFGALARRFGIGATTVRKAVSGESWKHVGEAA